MYSLCIKYPFENETVHDRAMCARKLSIHATATDAPVHLHLFSAEVALALLQLGLCRMLRHAPHLERCQ